ncbi:putative uncharacterized protein [Pseudomonas sp. StFLB209]|uniref:hypothetical protein n=1 Tax=Pseudomonas sp. StFLB209 TaxID=1028989 RepID=UPI0004F792BC|nr:hypothetical protein [Pseudomonas sp. StFLB209]BAP44760.1 putative uncharacterized protein [Pseudomonas sp. StFLB209]
MSKVIITFAKHWRGYAAGETAGFDEAVAQTLIDAGVATEHEGGKKQRRPAKPTSKPAAETRPEPATPAAPADNDEKP